MKLPRLAPCRPPAWAANGHAQTIFAHILPSPRLRSRGVVFEIELADGDKLSANYLENRSDKVVYLLHGLGLDATTDYMRRTANLCLAMGYSVYLINHRGFGRGAEWLARNPYHTGRAEDLSRVFEFGRNRRLHRTHTAIGFSLGGAVLLNLLTGYAGDCFPDSAITVNAPIDLGAASAYLGAGLNRLYDRRFVRLLKNNVRRRRGHSDYDWEADANLTTVKTLNEFDEVYTAPAGGFESRDHYYQTCSSVNRLNLVSIPTIMLTSSDDPFIPVESYRNAKLSPTTRLHVESTGGHMGYLTKSKTHLGNFRWLDYALSEFLKSLEERNG